MVMADVLLGGLLTLLCVVLSCDVALFFSECHVFCCFIYLFFMVPRICLWCLWCVIVTFPNHTHFLEWNLIFPSNMKFMIGKSLKTSSDTMGPTTNMFSMLQQLIFHYIIPVNQALMNQVKPTLGLKIFHISF